MLIVIPAALVAAAVLALMRGLAVSRRGASRPLATVAYYGYGSTSVVAEPVRREQNLALERTMARVARRLSPKDYESRLRLRLLQAGLYGTRTSRFLMIRLVTALVMLLAAVMYVRRGGSPMIQIIELVGLPALGWMVPETILSRRITGRLDRIEREAADMIDLLAISVQAGLGLDQALKTGAERLRGPLADEIRLMLNEIRVGEGRHDALARMASRADTPTIRAFARTMAQSEAMGVSVTTTLKNLAVDARMRKKARADEQAQKAPVKMVFPLATCLFPAIMIVAAGPGMLQVMRVLGG